MREPLVFLSHAGEDTDAARKLARLLAGHGLNIWLDVEQLTPGDRWQEKLEEALRQAGAVIVYVAMAGGIPLAHTYRLNSQSSTWQVFPTCHTQDVPRVECYELRDVPERLRRGLNAVFKSGPGTVKQEIHHFFLT